MSHPLDDVFDVTPDAEVVEETALTVIPEKVAEVPVPKPTESALDDDVEFSRKTLKETLEDTQKAIGELSDIAVQSQQPRAYEVLSMLISQVIQGTQGLVNIHARKKAAKEDEPTKTMRTGGVNVEHAVFVGKASDLLRELKSIGKTQQSSPAVKVTEDDGSD